MILLYLAHIDHYLDVIKLQIIGDWPSGLVDHDSFVEGVGGQIFLFDHQIGINHHFMDLQGPNQRTQLANALFDFIRLFLFVDSDVI